MFIYLLLCAVLAHCGGIGAKPLHSELASHVVIVTPQAQVHLEPGAKFGAAATFIHHLAPLARIAAPHDETIVYVPASAAAPLIPIEAIAHHVGRSSSGAAELALAPALPQTKQDNQIATIQQAFEQAQAAAQGAQTAAQEGFGQIGEQFAEAAASFSPASFFPPAASGGSSQHKEEKPLLKTETPASTQPLLPATGRHFFAFAAPSIPHIVDFVHGTPVLVGPVSAIRARSLQDASDLPIAALPTSEEIKPEAEAPLLKTELKKDEAKEGELLAETPAEREKTTEFRRFLEANALKDNAKTEEKLDEQYKRNNLQKEEIADQQQAAEPLAEAVQPQLKSSVVGVLGGVVPIAAPTTAVVVPSEVVDDSIVEPVVPQSKMVMV